MIYWEYGGVVPPDREGDMSGKITWGQLRKLRNGTGVAFTTVSGDKFAGRIIRSSPNVVRILRANYRGVMELRRVIITDMALMDWDHEMLAHEGD